MHFSDAHVWLASLIFASLSGYGGMFIARRSPRWYSEKYIAYLVSAGVGLLLGVVWLEFLPHSLESQQKLTPYLFLGGMLFIALAEKFLLPRLAFLDPKPKAFTTFEEKPGFHKVTEESESTVLLPHVHSASCRHGHHEHTHVSHSHLISSQAACSVIGCLLLCTFFDGLEMRAAFLMGSHTGWITLFALLFHVLPDGVVAASLAIAGGYSHREAVRFSFIVSFALVLGVLSASALNLFLPLGASVLPFAGGILLYVTMIHLFPIAFKTKRSILLLLVSLSVFAWIAWVGHS